MDSQSIKQWFEAFNKTNAEVFTGKTIIIAPSFPYLEEVQNLIKTPNTYLAAQDVDLVDKGAHTGATGIFQIKEFVKYAIVGHSERKESLDTALKKRDLCLENNIVPIVCFVETTSFKEVEKSGSLSAWEDPQNISVNGTYRAKDPLEIEEALESMHSENPLIYGGSVNRNNIKDLANISKINGVLIGNASLDPNHFLYIIENA